MLNEPTSLLAILLIIAIPLGISILVAASFVFVFLRSKKVHQETIAAWAPLAQSAGLQLEQVGLLKRPRLKGSYRGRPLTVFYGSRPGSENRQIYTTIRLDTAFHGVEKLTIHRLSSGEKMAKKVLPGLAKTGDGFFDQQFIIVANRPVEAVQRLLVQNTLARRTLSELNEGWFEVTLRDGSLSYMERGILKDVSRMKALLEGMNDLAGEFERR
jgi:hypothetical protein